MVAKSQATAACDRNNCDQLTSERVGAGSIRALLRICHTVDAARRWPSPASSPWMRRYPQVGFSAARRSASRRSSAEVDGRPCGRSGWVQCRAMRRRCQRNSVSGVTSHPARLGRANAAAIAASKLRSASVNSGRSTCRRSTASWWHFAECWGLDSPDERVQPLVNTIIEASREPEGTLPFMAEN